MGGHDIADLFDKDKKLFYIQREIGRLSAFERDNKLKALSNIIITYEDQSSKAASAQAYFAACVMLASAAEARLLFKCLQNKEEAEISRIKVGKIKKSDPYRWTLDQLISVCKEAGWLGSLEDDDFIFNVSELVNKTRRVRNLVHPSRHVEDRPYRVPGIEAYEDTVAGYASLCIVLADESNE